MELCRKFCPDLAQGLIANKGLEMKSTSHWQALPVYLRPVFLCLFVLALTVLKLWSAANAWFVEDEAYYRLWGQFPALSYYDHPPMIGWWAWAGQQLVGDTFLGTRLVVVLTSALGSLALWRTAFLLFDRRVAGWAVLFLNASILVGVGGILATPDAPSVLFWGLALWALAELYRSNNANWWLAVGLFAGLGLLSKYSVLFLGVGIVVWLLWARGARRWRSGGRRACPSSGASCAPLNRRPGRERRSLDIVRSSGSSTSSWWCSVSAASHSAWWCWR